jgi:hypothetical protein
VRGITVAVLAPTFGEVVFLVPFKHLETPDVTQITLADSISGEPHFIPGSRCEACELSLNAHNSSFVAENWVLSAALFSSG